MEKHYELKIGATEVLLRVEPPEKGKRANLNEIQKELRELEISFRMDHLFDIYRRSSNQFETLANRESVEYDILVQVSPGGQEAQLTVIPPQRGEDKLTPEKFRLALEKAKIEKGILYPELKRIMAERIENEAIVIARGKPSVIGQDGWIEFHTEGKGPQMAVEDNKVDYKELNLIKNVHEGDLVATVFPPTMGEDGFNVTGKVLQGHNGKRAKYRLGPNTHMNEEKTEIYATKPGFVVFSGDRVSIEDVFEVENVDSTSGNIHFSGVVRVTGQVEDNFVIEAEKGIEVGDTVGKAKLKSRGEIKIGGGVFGGTLETKTSVSAKFFNECQVSAGENVIAQDYILHSNIQAGKMIQVTQTPDGFANGGVLRAGDSIWVAVLGSELSEGRTALEVGMGFQTRRQFEQLQEAIGTEQASFEKLRKNLSVLQKTWETQGGLPAEQAATFDKMLSAARGIRQKMKQDFQEYQSLSATIANETDSESFVFVSSVAHPGTRIQIKRFKVTLSTPLESCAFRIINGELKAQDFGQAQKVYKMRHGKKPSN